jgi:hypothetical protein
MRQSVLTSFAGVTGVAVPSSFRSRDEMVDG